MPDSIALPIELLSRSARSRLGRLKLRIGSNHREGGFATLLGDGSQWAPRRCSSHIGRGLVRTRSNLWRVHHPQSPTNILLALLLMDIANSVHEHCSCNIPQSQCLLNQDLPRKPPTRRQPTPSPPSAHAPWPEHSQAQLHSSVDCVSPHLALALLLPDALGAVHLALHHRVEPLHLPNVHARLAVLLMPVLLLPLLEPRLHLLTQPIVMPTQSYSECKAPVHCVQPKHKQNPNERGLPCSLKERAAGSTKP